MVLGQCVELKPDGVGPERVARQPRPVDRMLALVDPMLGRPAVVVDLRGHNNRLGDRGVGRALPVRNLLGSSDGRDARMRPDDPLTAIVEEAVR